VTDILAGFHSFPKYTDIDATFNDLAVGKIFLAALVLPWSFTGCLFVSLINACCSFAPPASSVSYGYSWARTRGAQHSAGYTLSTLSHNVPI